MQEMNTTKTKYRNVSEHTERDERVWEKAKSLGLDEKKWSGIEKL